MCGFQPQPLLSRCVAALKVLGIEGRFGTSQTLFEALLALQGLVRSLTAFHRFDLARRQRQDRIVGRNSRLVFFPFKMLGPPLQTLLNPASKLKLALRFKGQFLEGRMMASKASPWPADSKQASKWPALRWRCASFSKTASRFWSSQAS